MYCNFCGNALAPNQTVCGKCGNVVLGRPTISRVEQHLRLLGILWMAYAVIHAVAGCILLIVAHTIFGPASNVDRPAFLHPLLTGIGFFILIKAGVSLITGFGLLERQSWGRPLALVMAFFALLNVPFGTALGVYTLWVLMSPQADVEYDRLASA
ncbi:MAG: hypothetical protein DMG64_16920 [Acidobacteria bacterium]|nr:MAG: hypothetical protein DMG64_16920 [Acidobacteriota bacterium]PYY02640.1 MAG: hypothetical protein DMG63_00385 [Acidobacteriota bacterium]